ncbi:MAG TPA: MBOAT family protein [Candidatus Onthocola stercorigallinarum]|nr:MBOAT family protein [Candidatus Onthocola stercorigallinarum]
MILTKFNFFVFLFITLILYYILPKRFQWIILLISSIFFLFYDNFKIETILFILLVIVTSYICGRLIYRYKDTKKSKIVLLIGILLILGQLIYLKYTNLFAITLNHLFNLFDINYQFDLVSRISPLGVSYYSLIMISYLIDIYRGICKPQNNILKCALFMSYFPQLTSGPFVRYNDMENKLYENHKFDYHTICSGLIRFLWGLFKVLVISQRLGIFVDTVYGNYTVYDGFFIVIAAMFFTLQLYTNFSGSIDIIMGASEMFGINLPENFRTPFFSKTITEFWRRWHITLGSWLKDYIFYPLLKSNVIQKLTKFCKKHLGKKASKKIPLYLSMFIMWLIIGVWHGGAYTYIIASGILQFIFILCEDLLEGVVKKVNKFLRIDVNTFSYKLYQCTRTFLLFSFAMIFFRATSISNAIDIIKNAFVWNPWILLDNSSLYTAGLDMLDFRLLIISLIVLFGIELLQRSGSVREKLFKQNIVFRWSIIYILLFAIIIFGCYGPGYDATSFIYRQF